MKIGDRVGMSHVKVWLRKSTNNEKLHFYSLGDLHCNSNRGGAEVTITSSVTDREGVNLVVACRWSLTCLDYGGLYSLTMLRLISAVSSDLGVWNAVLCNQNRRCLTDTGESTKN